MKIISKYKDFYDFLAQDHDSDLVYVRKPFAVLESYSDLLIKAMGGIGWSYQDYRYRLRRVGDISITPFIFGIYPYVYAQPILDVYNYRSYAAEPLSRAWCDEYRSFGKKEQKKRDNMEISIAKKLLGGIYCDDNKPVDLTTSKTMDINRYSWKVECPEIFMKIGAPVFVQRHHIVSVRCDGTFQEQNVGVKDTDVGKIQYVANPCLTRFELNVLKYWYDELNDLNTYINIENFLWCSKQEPEHIPDNNTKIVSHGFDLKTSFRKM